MAREPNTPKADLDVHSKPFSFSMVTLTAYGNERDAWSMLAALVEKADLSDGEKSSTKEMAGRRSSVNVSAMIGSEVSMSSCDRLKASTEARD